MKLARSAPLLRRSPLRSRPKRRCVDCGAAISPAATRCKRCSNLLNGVKAAEVRRAMRTERQCVCEQCGETFITREMRRPVRFCSQKCMGEAMRKPKTCIVCGSEFWVRRFMTKTCSPRCLRERKRVTSQQRGRNHPTGNSRKTWYAAREANCVVCGSSDGLHFHHVIYVQHVEVEGGDVNDSRNGMTLCRSCHLSHHAALKNGKPWRVPIQFVPVPAFDFAVDLLGEFGARDYFRRYYDTSVAL